MLNKSDFTGLDALVHGKTKTFAQKQAEKAANLQSKLETYGILVNANFTDADSGTFEYDGVVDKFRLGGGNDAPDAYGAFEHDPTKDNYEASQRKLAKQVKAYSDTFGVLENEVTPKNLDDWKASTFKQLQDSGFKVNQKVRMLPTEGQPERDSFKRKLVDVYNADNQEASELFNTPQSNAGYFESYNTANRLDVDSAKRELLSKAIPEQQSGWDSKGNASAALQGDGTYSYGDQDNLNQNQLEWASTVEKSNEANIGKPGDIINSLMGSIGKTNAALDGVKIAGLDFKNWITGERETSQMTLAGAMESWNYSQLDPANKATPEHLRQFEEMKAGTLSTAETQALMNSPQGKKMQELNQDVEKNILESAGVKMESAAFLNKIYASGQDTAYLKEFKGNAEKDGAVSAITDMLVNHPMHAIDQMAQSLPIMLTLFNVAGLAAMAMDKYNNAMLERIKLADGKPITNAEDNLARGAAMLATMFERVGAEVLIKKIPGMDKLAIALYNKLPITNRILTPVIKTVTIAIAEGASELGTDLSEQAGAKASSLSTLFDNIDTGEAAYATALGIGGGGGLSAPGAAVEIATGQKGNITRNMQKLADKLATPDTVDGTVQGNAIQAEIDTLQAKLDDTPDFRQFDQEAIQKDIDVLGEKLTKANPNALSEKHRTKLQAKYDKLAKDSGINPQKEAADRKAAITEIKAVLDNADTANVSDIPVLSDSINKRITEIDAIEEQTPELVAERAELEAKLAEPASEEQRAAHKERAQALYDAVTTGKVADAKSKEEEKPPVEKVDITEQDFTTATGEVDLSLDADGSIELDKYFDMGMRITDLAELYKLTPEQQEQQQELLAKWKALDEKIKVPEGSNRDSIGTVGDIVSEDNSELRDNIAEQANTTGTPVDQKFAEDLAEAHDLEQTIKSNINETSAKNKEDLNAVHNDVIDGDSKRFKGFNTYFTEIGKHLASKLADNLIQEKVNTVMSNMTTHAENTKQKATVYAAALEQAIATGNSVAVYAVRADPETSTNRLMVYSIEEGKFDAKTVAEDKADGVYVNIITSESGKLINAINTEAAYADKMVELATTYANTTFAKEATARVATTQGIADLNAKAATQTTTTASDNVDISTITNVVDPTTVPTPAPDPVVDAADDLQKQVDDLQAQLAEANAALTGDTTNETGSTNTDGATPSVDGSGAPTEASTSTVVDDAPPQGSSTAPDTAEQAAPTEEVASEIPAATVEAEAIEDIEDSELDALLAEGGKLLKDLTNPNKINSGLDVAAVAKLTAVGVKISAHYLKTGSKSFAAYSTYMVSKMGEGVTPFLKNWYEQVRKSRAYEGMATLTNNFADAIEGILPVTITEERMRAKLVKDNPGKTKEQIDALLKTRMAKSTDRKVGILGKKFTDLIRIKHGNVISHMPTEAFADAVSLRKALVDLGFTPKSAKSIPICFVNATS